MSDVYAELMAKSVYPSAERAREHAQAKEARKAAEHPPTQALPAAEPEAAAETVPAALDAPDDLEPQPAQHGDDLPPAPSDAFDAPAPFAAFDAPAPSSGAFDLPAPSSSMFDLPAPLSSVIPFPLVSAELPPAFNLPAPDGLDTDVAIITGAAPAEPSWALAKTPIPEHTEVVVVHELAPIAPVAPVATAPVEPAPVYLAAPVPMYIVAAPTKAPTGPFVPEAIVPIAPRPESPKSKKALSEIVGDYDAADWLEPVLRDLVSAGASDVHLTLGGISKDLTVEARTDGELELVKVVKGKDASIIVNKLKTMSDLATSSSRVPGDGRYILRIDDHPYRVRAVSLPLFDGGEKLVLRLPSTGPLKQLDKIGFTETNMNAVRALLAKPGGMTLIAGPMGEGKTTTAHATIMAIGTEGRAVIAVEDPVERVLFGVAQIEVNEEVGSGFGDIMKYLVRADFDTLFIGEIRDSLTAAAAVRMAKAGRRVISTIHATDNVTAMLRLIELSSDSPLSVLDAVAGVISQRLVRKLNPDTGGYDGRHPIHEVLFINDDFTDKLIANKSLGEIRAAAETTSTTFAANLKELVDAGITDNYEARRVIGHDV